MNKDNWISVETELPEYTELDNEFICYCVHDNAQLVTSLLFEEGRFLGEDGQDFTQFVTHWQKLPAPPTK